MQASLCQETNMVLSIIKPSKDSFSEHTSTMPSIKNGSPQSPLSSKIPKTNGQHTHSPSSNLTNSKLHSENPETKTSGASSNMAASLTSQERSLCPEQAINLTNSMLATRLVGLGSKQAKMESKMSELTGRVRQKQLKMTTSHARKQLDFYRGTKASKHEASTLSTVEQAAVVGPLRGPTRLMDTSVGSVSISQSELSKPEDSFNSLESTVMDESVLDQLESRLDFDRQALDEYATESSSDEEFDSEDTPSSSSRCQALKKDWERLRTAVGSRWSWLERRISQLNKQICYLDYKIQKRPSKQTSTFSENHSKTTTPYLALSNGVLNHIQKGKNGANGQFLPQLLVSGNKLQVKDLLSSGTLGRNLSLLVEETSEGCSRARPLEKHAKRKIIRKTTTKQRARREGPALLDPSYHPKLSLPHELPSRVLLTGPVKQILTEHSYSRQPLSKRRKAASSLAHISTARGLFRSELSPSPSPVVTPSSTVSKASSRRKQHSLSQSSVESFSPMSPPTHPDTPSQPPLKKRRMLTSTPSYDIDNIVIPYSMASTARLEKPEYKEILTPRWREVNKTPGFRIQNIEPSTNSPPVSDSEDVSDEAFSTRHGKCEAVEKKRFLNFISGGAQKKRGRPNSSSTSTPDPLSVSSPLPLKKRVFDSPAPSETELYASQYMGILPWQPREFPLIGSDLDALSKPPPPPAIVRGLLSPSLDPQFKSHTPSIASTLATPLSSPLSIPDEEAPVISPTEWIVVNSNSQLNSVNKDKLSDIKPTNGIVLKLTKRA